MAVHTTGSEVTPPKLPPVLARGPFEKVESSVSSDFYKRLFRCSLRFYAFRWQKWWHPSFIFFKRRNLS